MKIKIKENALEIFFENINISDDPKYYEEIKEFLKEVKGKAVYLQGANEEEKNANISKYERSKSFQVPINILDFDEDIQDEEIIGNELLENIDNIDKKQIFFKKLSTIFTILLIIIVGILIVVNITNNTRADNSKNKIEILTQEKNRNNYFIQNELEKQKEWRELKRQLNLKIDESKERVKDKLLDNDKLQIELINNSQ